MGELLHKLHLGLDVSGTELHRGKRVKHEVPDAEDASGMGSPLESLLDFENLEVLISPKSGDSTSPKHQGSDSSYSSCQSGEGPLDDPLDLLFDSSTTALIVSWFPTLISIRP